MIRLAYRKCSYQFYTKELRRNWRIDLERAVLFEGLDPESYYKIINPNSNQPLRALPVDKFDEIVSRRQADDTNELERILNLCGLEDDGRDIDTLQELLDCVLEAEPTYIGYDNEDVDFYEEIARLFESKKRFEKLKTPQKPDKGYVHTYNKFCQTYANQLWIPSFLSPSTEDIDKFLIIAEKRVWNSISNYNFDTRYLL